MSIIETVQENMKFWPPVQEIEGGVIVPTYAIYPSGKVVKIHITVTDNRAQASDGGGAFNEILNRGDVTDSILDALKAKADGRVVIVDSKGWILSPTAPIEQLPALFALVTSVSICCALIYKRE